MTEDEMIGWHDWLDGPKFEQAPGDGDGQGSQVCCSPWGHKELGTIEWLNWTDIFVNYISKNKNNIEINVDILKFHFKLYSLNYIE